jgi:hypothetical protein
MTTDRTIQLSVDPASMTWIAEIRRCMSVLGELVPCPVDLIEVVGRLPDRSGAFKLCRLPASAAGDHRIVLEPCQALRDLVAAVRAFEGMGEFVAELGHDGALPDSDDSSPNRRLPRGAA